jgi:TonB family protein
VRNTTVPEEKKQVEKPEGRPPGQVVYIGPSGDGTAPENARFLAEYNSKVEKETISRYRRADYKNPLPAPSATREMAGSAGDLKAHGLALKIDRPPAPPGRPPEKTAPPASPAADRLVLKIPDLRARPELNLPVDERTAMLMNSRQSEEMKGNSDRFELRLGGKQKISDLVEEEMPPGVAALMPGASKIAPVAGGPFADHVEGIEEGEGTFLNAREYRYANFFNRVKKEVSVRWAPGDELYKRDPSGAIYGQKDRLTVLHVVLDGKGQLQKAEVQQGSGLDFLDEEAIAAFQRASPFPNPPTGLMKDGVISFNFGFYVEFTSASMKMFRYGN